jgi:hypothetical protein
MRTKTSLLIVALLLVLTGALGCKRDPATQQAAAEVAAKVATGMASQVLPTLQGGEAEEPTAEPTEEIVEEETAAPEEATELQATSSLKSYREKAKWISQNAGEAPVETEILIEFVRDVPARRTVITSDGETSDFIQIGDTSYMGSGDEWVTMQTSEGTDISESMMTWTDPSSFVDQCKSVGRETLNGMATKHYHCDKEVFWGQGLIGLNASGVTVDEGSYDFWVSDEYDIAVKTAWVWKGKDADGKAYSWDYQSEIYDIDAPITIDKPAGAGEVGLPDDIPMMDGATEVSAFGQMVAFKVDVSPADVTAFYEQAMAANGWAKQDSPLPTMMSFKKDSRTATLMLGEEQPTDVTIIVAQE